MKTTIYKVMVMYIIIIYLHVLIFFLSSETMLCASRYFKIILGCPILETSSHFHFQFFFNQQFANGLRPRNEIVIIRDSYMIFQ